MAINEFQLAEAYVELTPRGVTEMRGALGTIKSDAVSMSVALQTASKHAQRMLLVGGGVVGLSLKMASDAEEAGSKFEAVFKGQSAEVEKWAETFGKSVGRSKLQLIPFLAQLQDTFVPLGFARDKATDLSKELTRLAIDLASFNHTADSEAVNLLTSALVGNHEAVRRFGIIITEATLKQELATMGYGKGAKEITEQAKVMARMNIIMRSTGDAQGDAARTGKSLANQVKALQGQFQELMVELGNAFIPAAKELTPLLIDVAKAIAEWVKENKEAIPQMAKWGAGILAFIAYGPRLFTFLKGATQLFYGLAKAMYAQAVAARVSAAATAGAGSGSAASALAAGAKQDAQGRWRDAKGKFLTGPALAALTGQGGTAGGGGLGAVGAAGGILSGLGLYAAFIVGPVLQAQRAEMEARRRATEFIKDEAKWREIAANEARSGGVRGLIAERRKGIADTQMRGLASLPEVTTTIQLTPEQQAAKELAERSAKELEGLQQAQKAQMELQERRAKIESRIAALKEEQEGATVERYGEIVDALKILEAELAAASGAIHTLDNAISQTEAAIMDRDERERVAALRDKNAKAFKEGDRTSSRDPSKLDQAFYEMTRTSAAQLQSIMQDKADREMQRRLDEDRNRKLDQVANGVAQVNTSVRQINVGFG